MLSILGFDSMPVGLPDSELGPSPPPPPLSNGRNRSPPSDDQELGSISVAIAKKDSAKSGCYVEGNYKVGRTYGSQGCGNKHNIGCVSKSWFTHSGP